MNDWSDLHRQRTKTEDERFWEKVDKSGDCWEWQGACNAGGYGIFAHLGGSILAHRKIIEIEGSDIPSNLCVLHTCDNPKCVNPDHLWFGTRTDNNKDRDEKGRLGRRDGNHNGRAKLTENDIPRIRDMLRCGAMQTEIAKWFDVHPCTISDIKHGRRWTHVN